VIKWFPGTKRREEEREGDFENPHCLKVEWQEAEQVDLQREGEGGEGGHTA